MPSLTLRTEVRGDPRSTALTVVPVDAVARAVIHPHVFTIGSQDYAAPPMHTPPPTPPPVHQERTTIQKRMISAWSTCI